MTDGSSSSNDSPRSPARWLRRAWTDRLDPHFYLGLHLTVGLVAAVLGIWLFGAVLDAVLANERLVRWDIATDAAIHSRMTMRDLRAADVMTQLGAPVTMALLGLGGAVFLWHARRTIALVGWLAAFGGGLLIDMTLKAAVHRPRPTYGAAYLHGHTYSFPSGHSMGSIIGYGMLLYLVHHAWAGRTTVRGAAYVATVAIILLIGLSRILLGVHYPSDVLGGWAAGLAWMAVCMTGVSIAQQRHADRMYEAVSSKGPPA
ncbi:MAG: phosphatase PAP2 family protein [Gemmatimonadota bacterium]|nr:phosphatase PAP2 family protein [Gemmatimonadota bacterium]